MEINIMSWKNTAKKLKENNTKKKLGWHSAYGWHSSVQKPKK